MSKDRQPNDTDQVLVRQYDSTRIQNGNLPSWRKICFAIGGAPYQTTNTVINFFISIFLLEVAVISPGYVSVILFVGKAWDAITDPTCGYLVHRFTTRFGKFRPWILFSAPLACGTYFSLWYVPDMSEAGKFGWYFCWYCLFQTFLTMHILYVFCGGVDLAWSVGLILLSACLHVPFTSMTMAITNSQRDRDSVTAYRMIAEAFGVLLAVVVQGQLVSKYRKVGDCDKKNEPTKQELEDEKWSYMLGAFIVIGAYMVCSCTVFFGTKENPGFTTMDQRGFFSGARQVLTFKPYVLLSTSFLFLSLAIAIVQGNLALFCTHSLDMGKEFSYFILVLLISAICSMPLWQQCIVKFGKKTTFAAGMIMFIPVLLAQLYIPKGVVAYYYPVLVIAGCAVSVALLLPWSMLPDVIDEFVVKNNTRKESIFYSFYVFFNKLSVGVGLGISQAILSVGGYKSGECKQSDSVGLALRLLVVPGPVVFTLIALIALWAYPIDEIRRKELKMKIEEMTRKLRDEQDQETIGEPLSTGNRISDVSYQSITVSSGL